MTTEKEIQNLTKDYVSVLENTKVQNKITEEEMIATGGWTEMDINKEKTAVPTLLSNKKYIKTFEVITQSQGIPGSGERDPTPIIAFVWPLFYGIMFADLGHGLLLFGLGMLLRQRGNGSITTWGTLIAASGAAAALAGLGTGEVFGFHVTEIAILKPVFEPLGSIVGVLNVSELSFDQVIKILKVSVAIGIVHILMAHFLRVRKDIQ